MTVPNDLLTAGLPACASTRRAEVSWATSKSLRSQAKPLLRQTTILPERHLQWSSPHLSCVLSAVRPSVTIENP
jgi:hypothetical protein